MRKAGDDKPPLGDGEIGPGLVAVDLLPLREEDEDAAVDLDFALITCTSRYTWCINNIYENN